MDGYCRATNILPEPLRSVLRKLPSHYCCNAQEIRLRSGHPVSLHMGAKRWFVYAERCDCCEDSKDALICRPEWVTEAFDVACERSVYAHQEEVRKGYVTTRDGVRLGIGGTAVVQNNRISTYRSITSLCIRIPRDHPGCSSEIVSILQNNGRVRSALICGEPASGKSTILRDIIQKMSADGASVVVVDERGELQGAGFVAACDVLLGAPKALGIEQAIRCLAPSVVVFDELGDQREVAAVTDGIRRGVPTIATAHAVTPKELLSRSALRTALQLGAFEYVFFLSGRETPGRVKCCYRSEVLLHEDGWGDIDAVDGSGTRRVAMA